MGFNIVGKSEKDAEDFDLVSIWLRARSTVLIHGESGTA
jgi:transcriptional regulator with GAF, ATPase, and Fis domain